MKSQNGVRSGCARGWVSKLPLLLVATLVVVAVGTVVGPPVAKAAEKGSVLDKRGNFNFRHAHLKDVVGSLEKQFKVEIRIDETALDDLGPHFDKEADLKAHREQIQKVRQEVEAKLNGLGVPATESAKVLKAIEATPYPGIELIADNISLRSALAHILRSVDPSMRVMIKDKAVVITSKEVVDLSLITQVFNVEDLVKVPRSKSKGPFAPIPVKGSSSVQYNYEMLIEILTTTIDPTSWDEVGGPGRIAEGQKTLIISQTRETLNLIEPLLATLRTTMANRWNRPRDLRPVRIETSPAQAAARKRIETALDGELELDIRGTSLRGAVETLRKLLHIPIRLDQPALHKLGVNSNSPIHFSRKKGVARDVLDAFLSSINESVWFMIQDEVLVITSREHATVEMLTVVYPITDLLEASLDKDEEVDQGDLSFQEFEVVIEAITTTVEPTAWDEVGGASRIHEDEQGGSLVISTTPRIHRKIETLLQESRRLAAEQEKTDAASKVKETDDFVTVVFLLWQPHDEKSQVGEDELVKLLKQEVAPESWKSDKVTVRTLPSRLIIRQKKSVHRGIYKVLVGLQVLKPIPDERGHVGKGAFSGQAAGGGFGSGGFGGGSPSADLEIGSAGQLRPANKTESEDETDATDDAPQDGAF